MGAKPTYRMHGGYRMPLGFPPESFSSAVDYCAQPGDIILSTYPKCGTTWVQYIVYLLLHDGTPLSSSQLLGDFVPHLEEIGKHAVEDLSEPRAIKTHFSYAMTPAHPDARYIVVIRNPFDCVVSFYHHTRGFDKHYKFLIGTFDDFFECFLVGKVDFGDYFDHLGPWYRHRNDRNVLLLIFEDMKDDPVAAVTEIAEFLELSGAKDEEFLADVAQRSSFDEMRKGQDRWSSRRPGDMPAFVRKGIVGDWRNYFSPEQAHRLVDKFSASAETWGFTGLWSDIIRAAEQMS